MNRELHSGMLVVDKPEGPTSHDIVQQVRRIVGVKVGHTGTLDPLATGVLPLLIGQATRLMRFYQNAEKTYLATLRLGVTTDTFDREGRILSTSPVPHLEDAQVEKMLKRFRGEIKQLPPMFSAVKLKGERLYQAARRGETLPRQPRDVTIFALAMQERTAEQWTVRVDCSSGTYIRSLAHDLGQALGCGAHLSSLRRIRSGTHNLSQAVDLKELTRNWMEHLQPLEALLLEFPRIDLDHAAAERVRNGNPIVRPLELRTGHQRLFSCGHLVSISTAQGEVLQPVLVFSD